MTDYSSKITTYLNENYTDSYTDSDGNTVKYFTFSSSYFIKCLGGQNYYILEKSGADEEKDCGRLNFYLPSRAFTKDEIKSIIDVEPTCNDYGIVI